MVRLTPQPFQQLGMFKPEMEEATKTLMLNNIWIKLLVEEALELGYVLEEIMIPFLNGRIKVKEFGQFWIKLLLDMVEEGKKHQFTTEILEIRRKNYFIDFPWFQINFNLAIFSILTNF